MKTLFLTIVFAGLAGLGLGAPGVPKSMFGIYAENRANQKANYITEDFLLLSYSLILEDGIGSMEENQAEPDLQKLVAGLHKALPKQPYFEVLSALLGGDAPKDPKAIEELALIRDAQSLTMSPLFSQMIDYTQSKPRGKYTSSEKLSRYFQAMRYAGLVLFYVKDSAATGVTPAVADSLTSQALEIASAIQQDKNLRDLYERFLKRATFLFGPPEDLDLDDLLSIDRQNPPRPQLLDVAKKNHRQPVILGGAIDVAKLEKGVTSSDALTGWRLFPSRYTPDSAAIQQLVYDRVTDFQGQGTPFTLGVVNGRPVKAYPRASELMALLGSQTAQQKIAPDTKYAGYAAASQSAQKALLSGSGLAAMHMQIMQYWLSHANAANGERRLNTALSFFTLHRHQNILYAKQSYTAVAKSIALIGQRGTATIEPAPELYLLLRRATARAASELAYAPLAEYGNVLDTCIDIAFGVAANRAVSAEQSAFLNDLDLEVSRLTPHGDTPLVADIHTDPNSKIVIEEGIGFPKTIVKNNAIGALFVHREFKQPMDQRLTDEEWAAKLLHEREIEASAVLSKPVQAGGARSGAKQ